MSIDKMEFSNFFVIRVVLGTLLLSVVDSQKIMMNLASCLKCSAQVCMCFVFISIFLCICYCCYI